MVTAENALTEMAASLLNHRNNRMEKQKQSYMRLTSPRGVFIYPRLTEPDKKFVKPDGEYHTKFALAEGEDSTDEFIETLETELKATRKEFIADKTNKMTKAKVKRSSIADLYEVEADDEGEETGRLIFKFKLKARIVTKDKAWDQKPRLFDAQAEPIEAEIRPWTGTEGKCSLELFPYYMESTKQFGLSLRLKGAQILKLVEGSGESAEDQGFESEAGYTQDDSAEPESGFEEETPDGGDPDDPDEEEF